MILQTIVYYYLSDLLCYTATISNCYPNLCASVSLSLFTKPLSCCGGYFPKTLKKHQKLTKTVSDQLKNSRLASSSSSQLKHLLSSSLPSSGSMHHQDPLEAALLAAARGQHGAGIPGNVIHVTNSSAKIRNWSFISVGFFRVFFYEIDTLFFELNINVT